MQTLNQDIKNHSFKQIYLLYGEESYLKNNYKNQLKTAITQGDTMNFNLFSGKGIDVKEVISLADTIPFFGDRRLILIEDSGFFKRAVDELVTYLSGLPDTTYLVFVESEVDKRSKMFKKVKELGYAAEMGRQDFSQLARWSGTILTREGKKITGHTMERLLGMVGDDMENIRMELEKLISYTLGREIITDEDVDAVCTVRITNKIFDMVTAIVNRQTKKAMDLYEDLLALKEPPMRILFLIGRQFNQILQVKELMGKGMEKSGIASKLKIPPFAAGKLMPQARSFQRDQIISYVNLCVDMEESVKTGRLGDRLAVELLLTLNYSS
ncbi:DNA polymerase III subunit delta [Clostridium sp. E02]|uniref:DNA polymerase III subunit delta n=1 Tax=Clostridium sp. E02 TaxID=2487134 RepID=UPI000F53AAA6|nr:DNA polymerase III subunit delta [Clostridium sp. E02]